MKSLISTGATHRTVHRHPSLTGWLHSIIFFHPAMVYAQELSLPFGSQSALLWLGRLGLMMGLGSICFIAIVMTRERRQGSGSRWTIGAWLCFPLVGAAQLLSGWISQIILIFSTSIAAATWIQWVSLCLLSALFTHRIIYWADQDI